SDDSVVVYLLCFCYGDISASFFFFFFNFTATTVIYTLSLHDALPISDRVQRGLQEIGVADARNLDGVLERHEDAFAGAVLRLHRSEEHTSELQSRFDLVCRLLLEKKKNIKTAKENNVNKY